MSFQKVISRSILVGVTVMSFAAAAFAQSMMVAAGAKGPKPVVSGNNLYCAGYIQTAAISEGNRIIGAQNETDGWNFSENNFMYVNMGRDKGVNVGDVFAVVRPRGEVKSKWSDKSDLGFYVQEVGALEVVKVKDNVSAVRVKTSCDSILLGDLVQLVEKRNSPPFERGAPMDIFGDPSGKPTGRILMARDGAELLTRDFVAYVDIGADENVKIGDKLTIFRLLEDGSVTRLPDRESVSSRDYGFQSEDFKGGKFSNQSTRKSGEKANGQEVRQRDVRNERPEGMRKVVGEAIVLNVKEKTATVVITRTAQEIHPGDWVEIK